MTSDPITTSGAALASAIDTLKKAFDQAEAAQCGEAQLLPIGKTQTLDFECAGNLAINVSSPTSEATFYKNSGASEKKDIAGCWWGTEYRRDTRGHQWHRSIQKLVVNDFGDLVEVAA